MGGTGEGPRSWRKQVDERRVVEKGEDKGELVRKGRKGASW